MSKLRSLLIGVAAGVVSVYGSRAVAATALGRSAEGVLSYGSLTGWWVPTVVFLLNVVLGIVAVRFGGYTAVLAAAMVAALVLLPAFWGHYVCPPDLPGCNGAPLALREDTVRLVLVGLLLPATSSWMVKVQRRNP